MKLSEIPAACKRLADENGWRVVLDGGIFTVLMRRHPYGLNFYREVTKHYPELIGGSNGYAFDCATGGSTRRRHVQGRRRAGILRRMLLRTFNLKGRI